MSATQRNRFLAISTALGGDTLLLKSLAVSEQMGRLFQLEAELHSDDRAIKFDDVVGTNATVQLKTPGGQTRYLNGFISRFVQVEHQGSYAVYRATLVPWLWFLTRTSDCRIFQKKKIPDIIEEVFKGHGFKDYKLKLDATYGEWDFCVQYRETDFNFVSRLMEQEGIYYFFEHKDGVHTLVLTDSTSAHEPYEGYDTLTYRPPTARQEESTETVTDWVIEKEIQPGLYAVADFNHLTPKASIVGNANISRTHQGADFEIFDYPGEFEQRDEGESYAKLRIQELQAQHETLRAQATARGIAVGCKFTLKGHPRSDQNRDYLIIGASLNINAGEYETGKGGSGEFYSCSFTAIPATEQFRSARTTPKPLIQGPQTAIVVGPKGEEIHTDDQARVKVHFHWDRHGQYDENASCWIRVSQSNAGKGWGSMITPRIGQEVIVEFLEGDPDRPIITGRVYNAEQTPPYAAGSGVVSGLKSKTHKGGGYNEMSMDDTPGKEMVTIHGQFNMATTIENDQTNTIHNNRTTGVDVDDSETVGSNQTIKVGADQKADIGANQDVTIGADQKVGVGANQKLTVGADQTNSISGSQKNTIGGSLETSASSDNHTIAGDQTISAGSRTVSVNGADKLTAGGTLTIGASGAIEITSGASIKLSAGSGVIEIGPGGVTISGAVVDVTGGTIKNNG